MKGIFSAAVTILVWGITFVNTRALLGDFSPLEIMLLRFGLAWLVLCAASWVFRNRGSPSPKHTSRDELLFASMGLTGVAVYQLLENCAIVYTNASTVAILVSFAPIVTAILARVALRDQTLSLRFVLGGLVSICGVALVSLTSVQQLNLHPVGILLTLLAMVSWGFYSMLVDKVNARGYAQVDVMSHAFGWALVFLLPLVIFGATPLGHVALGGTLAVALSPAVNGARFSLPLTWFNLAFLGVLASAVCFVLWSVACKSLGMVKATIGLYLTPIIGVVFAALFLDERMTGLGALGGVLIVLGVILARSTRKA